ncbi:carbohydrate esterase family 3 protein [Colletotrichum incanum]|uniref:non-specific serine/threonine protein kinase n=1 Tax=Colletotrichum incanum TaxID=1573173 RepID=A0A167C727_COLIC|nr:carbohydrate esterase family 3 protein [Colletotrichum incanum]
MKVIIDRTMHPFTIYGSNGVDYIYLKEEEDYYDVLVWENKGSGGTKQKGDGVFYCDMRGTDSDDYVWIYADGHSNEIFANTHNTPFWDPNYDFEIKVPGLRTGIHLADWTGNGRCDVLVQNKKTGDISSWENQWNAGTKTLRFANRGVVASPGCSKGWGVGIFDRGMRIADMEWATDGLVEPPVWHVQRRPDEAHRRLGRANLRLADVENSGRADIIWLNKYTGAGSVWKNNGYAGPNGGGGGSSFSWTKRGVLYSPIDRGEVMNFANLGGLGKADLIQVYPATNEAYTFFNKYGGGGGSTGDDGPIESPGLPVYGSDTARPVPPTPVDKLTMSLTVNNVAERSFTKGYNVTLTLDKCKALGNVVLKFYLQPDQREDERNHLAKIDELKAVFDKNHNNSKNKQAIIDFVYSAIELTVADIRAYLHNYYIMHDDVTNGNVLMRESGGKVTYAKLVDCDKPTPLPRDVDQSEIDGLHELAPQRAENGFGIYRV